MAFPWMIGNTWSLKALPIMNFPRHDMATGFRRQAAAIRAVANSISLNDVKQKLFESAKHLDALAEEEERKAQTGALSQRPQPRT